MKIYVILTLLTIQGLEDKMQKKLLKFKDFWRKHGSFLNASTTFILIWLYVVTKIYYIAIFALISSNIYLLIHISCLFEESKNTKEKK